LRGEQGKGESHKEKEKSCSIIEGLGFWRGEATIHPGKTSTHFQTGKPIFEF
jgi:hypothetical protein